MPDSRTSLYLYLLIFIGSGGGGVLRHLLGGWMQSWCGTAFPVGTLMVNVTGCLLMGFLATLWTGPTWLKEEYRSAILIGILGGYTTFSSFSRETLTMAQQGEWSKAGSYVFGSVASSLLAVWIGAVLANKLWDANAS